MSSTLKMDVDLRQMIMAIEAAVSQVGMNDTNHGKRVGYIASQIANELGFDDNLIHHIFDLGLLHDCGVSTEQMHANLVNHFDWNEASIHCEIGFRLLKDFEPLADFAYPIRHHHTHFEELKDCQLSERNATLSNLIFLSDRIDVLAYGHYGKDILLARDEVVKTIMNYRGTLFDPQLLEAFQSIERSEAFWISLEDRHITRYTWDMGQFHSNKSLSLAQLKQMSLIMAYIVDQKSPFTALHSARVAALAKFLAETCGLSLEQCEKIEVAGLLHDLGKLHTPDKILEKRGALSPVERSIINQHSYETFEILRHIQGLNEIASWAAFHHEGLNGSGYPFHLVEKDLSIEARIIAVADIFQALVQDRPYRHGMALQEVLTIIDEDTASGKLDREIVELVRRHAEECFKIAEGVGEEESLTKNFISLDGV